MYQPSGERAREASRSPFLPLLLLLLAVLAWFGFQTLQLAAARGAARAAFTAQEQTVQNATRLRGQLDSLATATQRLADGGNPNARLVVGELHKRGVTINPDGAAAAPATR